MTDHEIIEAIAEKFMGWQERVALGTRMWQTKPESRLPWIPCVQFDPLHDPAACTLILDEIERRGWDWTWDCNKRFDDMPYGFSVVVDAQAIGEWADNRYRAVCLAVLRALEVANGPDAG